MAESSTDQLRSFVTFALAMKPAVIMHRKADEHGPELTLKISTSEQLQEAEIASLEPLMAKYKPLKSFLDAIMNTDESVATCKPTTNFEPMVHHRLIRIPEQQFRLAKEVATRLSRINASHAANDLGTAKQEYDEFHKYLTKQRAALVGEFQGIQFSDAVASYGGSRDVTRTDNDCSGAVIFVVVEIYVF